MKNRKCDNCKSKPCQQGEKPCDTCLEFDNLELKNWEWDGVVAFQKLNGIKPTTQGCTLKVIEETGELMQVIGKHSGMSGEKQTMSEEVRIRRTIFEALDVAQSATTMAHTLCELHGLSLESFIERHEEKLRKKGYIV